MTLIVSTLLKRHELKACLVCETEMSVDDIDAQICTLCTTRYMFQDQDLEDLLMLREYMAHDLAIDPSAEPSKPIWIWEEQETNQNEGRTIHDRVYPLYVPTSHLHSAELPKSPTVDNYMVCCEGPRATCECDRPMSYLYTDHMLETDTSVNGSDIYDSSCSQCAFYWDFDCKPYREWLASWAATEMQLLPQQITRCEDFLSNDDYYKKYRELGYGKQGEI